MGWQWHQLDHMQFICSRQITMPAPHHSIFVQAQLTVSKHWRHTHTHITQNKSLVHSHMKNWLIIHFSYRNNEWQQQQIWAVIYNCVTVCITANIPQTTESAFAINKQQSNEAHTDNTVSHDSWCAVPEKREKKHLCSEFSTRFQREITLTSKAYDTFCENELFWTVFQMNAWLYESKQFNMKWKKNQFGAEKW